MNEGPHKAIHVVGLLLISNRRILLTRSKGKNGFYLPGGKSEPNEGDIEALEREIHEELGCKLVRADIAFYSRYVAQAFGEPEGVLVSMIGSVTGTPIAQSEIAEAHFFTSAEYQQMPAKAPAVEALLADLLIEHAID